jgi:hypothetical protein
MAELHTVWYILLFMHEELLIHVVGLCLFNNGMPKPKMLVILFVSFLLYPVSNALFSLFLHSRWVIPRNPNQW